MPMSPGGRASIHRDITQLEQEQRSLALNEPKRFTVGGGTQANAAVLADLGFGELRDSIGNGLAARRRMWQRHASVWSAG